MYQLLMSVMEVIGTVAFSVSGALIAISCNLDIFGVTFIGCVTAFGGGILRDILIGKLPPAIFFDIKMLLIAGVSAWFVFLFACLYAKHFEFFAQKTERVNNIFDAIGLSVFSVIGTETACAAGLEEQAALAILMGMITGVGGGIFRDVLVDKTPYVLKKHVYALASLTGSMVYYVMRTCLQNTVLATVTALILVFSIRMLATHFHWKLPKVRLKQ